LKRAYLDTNVLVMGILKHESNSRRVLELANGGEIHTVICDYSIEELKRVLRRLLPRKEADRRSYLFIKYAASNPFIKIVKYQYYKHREDHFKEYIVKKDLPHLIVAIETETDVIIVKDRHFTSQKLIRAMTPREFLQEIGKDVFEGDL